MRRHLATLTCLFALTFAASPAFVPDFGGFDADQFPIPQDNPPAQPATYAFAIWGVIYLWLIVGTAFGAWKRREDQDWHAMRMPLAASLAVGTFWLAVALASPVWAAVLIWVMLVTALAALHEAPDDDRGWAALPVGLYAGWLTAAASVSIGLLLAGYGWTTQTTAAVLSLGLALGISLIMLSEIRRAPTYGIGVIWALVAVVVQNAGSNLPVAALAGAGALGLALPTLRGLASLRS